MPLTLYVKIDNAIDRESVKDTKNHKNKSKRNV